LQRSHFRK